MAQRSRRDTYLCRTRTRAQRSVGVAALLCALVLAGCSTVPAYRTPDVALPPQWTSTKETAPPATEPIEWWTELRSPRLNELVARGLGDGLDVTIALARLEQARGMAQIAGAGRYPTLGVGADVSRGSTNSSSGKRSLTLQGSLNLDLWGASGAKAKSADMTVQASESDLATARQTLASNIALGYLQLLALDERILLATRIADDAQNLLSLVEKQASLGAASTLDVQQQRNAVQTFLAAIPVLRLQRDTVFGQLAVLVNETPQQFTVARQSLLDVAVPQVQAIAPADAVAARPEVQAAEARLEAANFDVGVARAAFLPAASITAQTGWLLNPTAALWSIAGSVLQPLFDGGQREGQLRVDRAHAEELVASYRQVILQVLQETETQLVAVQRLHEAETLDAAAVDSASESLRLSRIRFERGASDLLTVIINERTLYQAQDTLLQARLQRLQATVGLYRALGGRAPAQQLAVATPSQAQPNTK